MMAGLVHLPAFVMAAVAVIVVPGPATVLVATCVGVSRRTALLATAGILAGDVVAITLAGAGMAGMVAQAPGLMQVLRLLGAGWIGYLGVCMLRAPTAQRPIECATTAPPGNAFLKALGMTLTNPKPLLFFAGFFPLFIAPGGSPSLGAFWRLGAVFEALNIAWFSAVMTLAGMLARRQRDSGPGLQRLGGMALLGCAALVLLA
ncbi:MAG: LysE family translocator [Vitreoscilla sp.]